MTIKLDHAVISFRDETQGIVYGNGPGNRRNMELHHRNRRRGLHFEDRDGHPLKRMTR